MYASMERVKQVLDERVAQLKEFITTEINGNDVKLVIKKELYASDLLKHQNRLSLPINQLETREFLTEEERKHLEKDKELEVPLLGPTLQFHDKSMMLKKWHLTSSCSYVLKTNWNDFVKVNKDVLKEHTNIHVWSFRRDKQLCFALACIDEDA
ncbi:hypothetical protein L2E82_13957 [Cichorium intybus]|uniref:Uncharacterized protein n=1 Tax=Cichorium intybus TaxID=13427 RepID=A0ACB9EY38_CICIN|nr:hypothetical protein L2E82_13957 [Cichorium intybus]